MDVRSSCRTAKARPMFSKRVDVPVRTMTAHVGHLAGTVRTGKRVKWLPGDGRT